jgi:hypothetical protein
MVAVLLMSSFSSSAFAAKASDPDPQPQVLCVTIAGHTVCVRVS